MPSQVHNNGMKANIRAIKKAIADSRRIIKRCEQGLRAWKESFKEPRRKIRKKSSFQHQRPDESRQPQPAEDLQPAPPAKTTRRRERPINFSFLAEEAAGAEKIPYSADFESWQKIVLADIDLPKKLRGEELKFVWHPSFSDPELQTEIKRGLKLFYRRRFPFYFPESASGELDENCLRARSKILVSFQRPEVFILYNYCRWRLCRILMPDNNGDSESRAKMQSALTWFKQVLWLRECLANAHMAWAKRWAERFMPGISSEDRFIECRQALLRAISCFDFSRDTAFSTYAAKVMHVGLARLYRDQQSYLKRFPVSYDPDLEKSDEPYQRRERQRADALDKIRQVLLRNTAGLTPDEKKFVKLRFRFDKPSSKGIRPLKEIGVMLRVAAQRARQIEKRVLAKLKIALEEMP